MWVAVALGAAACGNIDGTADTDTTTAPIFNGVNISASELNASGLVAVYHPKLPDFPNFFPRPCSGVIVASTGGLSWVLTARHCVTTDDTVGGTLVAGSQLRLSPTLNPGPALPNPPASAVPAFIVVDKFGTQNDIAIVAVQVDWSSIANNRIGLWVGGSQPMVNMGFTAYGYGINVADGSCGVDNSTAGAGVARSGATFTINGATNWSNDSQPANYTFGATSTGGQAVFCGDSGGPDEMGTGTSRTLLGVHSTGATTVGNASSTPFDLGLQQALGLFLTPQSQSASDNLLGENPSTGIVEMVAPTNSERKTVSYDSSTKLLLMNGGCVSAANGSPAPLARVATCNANDQTQLWSVLANGQIVNPVTNKCLNAGSGGVALSACTVVTFGLILRPTSTIWKFHTQL